MHAVLLHNPDNDRTVSRRKKKKWQKGGNDESKVVSLGHSCGRQGEACSHTVDVMVVAKEGAMLHQTLHQRRVPTLSHHLPAPPPLHLIYPTVDATPPSWLPLLQAEQRITLKV